ncbi:uncharacterized protein ARB_04251 [Trichophyton benhamiae CBS 112371]|uniref:Uncharacterized protein n=1 Tax=Arthroderma benhamiae (strain ATCC MYA-4681 / CBS 112371) TaxID=663331 RepID=D4AJ03_ARTBC|nr:uncharacterized protein ARB_04251 [Trichophyton benhamiae CBS 112371]EFE36726.1 hypothetical protein ARB_04251 [Trichophyton benhamiae CBS 112371]
MEEETEERKRRKKKTAGEEEAIVVCVLFVCLLGKKQASWAEHEREATGSKEGARRRMRRLAPSPLRPGPGGPGPAAASGREDTWLVLRLQQAAAERHLSQEEENIRIKHGAERDTKGVSSCSALGYEGREALRSLTRHTAYLVRQLLFRTAYKAGWTASLTLLATILALLRTLAPLPSRGPEVIREPRRRASSSSSSSSPRKLMPRLFQLTNACCYCLLACLLAARNGAWWQTVDGGRNLSDFCGVLAAPV